MTHSSSSASVAQQLHEARQAYQYNYTYIPPLAMVDTLTPGEGFSRPWFFLVARVAFKLLVNYIVANRGNRGKAGVEDDVKTFLWEVLRDTISQVKLTNRLQLWGRLLLAMPRILGTLPQNASGEDDQRVSGLVEAIGTAAGGDFLTLYAGNILGKLRSEIQTGRIKSLADYEKLFPVIAVPELAHTFEEDETFARMRVAGPNPAMLRRMTAPDPRFPITNEQYQTVMGPEDSLSAAMDSGRLYWVDYGILDGAIDGTYPRYQKYLFAPMALFAIPPGTDPQRTLQPVAIQHEQTPGPDNPIITPASGKYNWLLAKALFNMVDVNFHEAVSHLARTHLLVGPFVIATHRQLPDTHPLHRLLVPHFQGTLAINNAAQSSLVAPRGGVDVLLSSTIENDRVLVVNSLYLYPFNDNFLPDQFERWGVNDESVFPVYPYRDDAQLIWAAIHQWVSDYLQLYYADDPAVQQDALLQNWAAELVAFDGGRVVQFGEPEGSIHSLDYLTNAITMVIYTGSAQHAAVNFPQKDLMTYAPTMPTAGYHAAETLSAETNERDYLDFFPPLDQAQGQLNLLYLLGSVYFTQLGAYEDGYFTDTRVQAPLEAFQARLIDIEATISQRNTERFPYSYLLPSNIPQSINI